VANTTGQILYDIHVLAVAFIFKMDAALYADGMDGRTWTARVGRKDFEIQGFSTHVVCV
jgi:hypothetical protein